MSFKNPSTLAGRTVYRLAIIGALLTGPVLLPIAMLIDYFREDYVRHLKEIYQAMPAAFRKGGAL